MTTKKKNKRIVVISIIVAVVIAISMAALYFSYRSNTEANNTARCKATISDVHSKSSKDPLYEPPMQYFECIDAL